MAYVYDNTNLPPGAKDHFRVVKIYNARYDSTKYRVDQKKPYLWFWSKWEHIIQKGYGYTDTEYFRTLPEALRFIQIKYDLMLYKNKLIDPPTKEVVWPKYYEHPKKEWTKT